MKSITIIQPDDWHLHLRDGDALQRTVADTARCFARAIVMPNLAPPITDLEKAIAYKQRIIAATSKQSNFQPLMTLYLTEQTTPELVKQAKQSGEITAIKYYPAGATTHSSAGVADLQNVYPTLAAMQEVDMPLLIHGEVTNDEVDVFDRESVFLERCLKKIVGDFPKLRIVLEHITTKNAVEFINNGPDNLAATITAHHLLANRNNMLVKKIRPHYYCLPILKRAEDQQALIAAATSGNKKFFLGTDSAPHAKNQKECSAGCAGIYTAHAAIELYTQVFEQADALDQLEKFASINGANFYQLPVNTNTITLEKREWTVEGSFQLANETLVPFHAGQNMTWAIAK
jgi:dihydroorotase